MKNVDWYFDFVSPHAYFGFLQLESLPDQVNVRLRPVLFAGLLNYWGQKGPAEIPSKRLWTYRWCTWWARKEGIPFRLPAMHPFNPLPYLRLAIAAGNNRSSIEKIFNALWATGRDPHDSQLLQSLADGLGVAPERIGHPAIKDQLKKETDRAIAKGVFGVPTLSIDGHLFWGNESMDMALGYLADDSLFDDREMKRISRLPMAARRKSEK